MVGWVAGGREGVGEARGESQGRSKEEKPAADIFNICLEYFKALWLFEISVSGNNGPLPPELL